MRGLDQPFVSFINRIKVLEHQLEANAKPTTDDASSQTHIEVDEKGVQTTEQSDRSSPDSQLQSSSSLSKKKTFEISNESGKVSVHDFLEEIASVSAAKDEVDASSLNSSKLGPVDERKLSSTDGLKKNFRDSKDSSPFGGKRIVSGEERSYSPTKGEGMYYRSGGTLLSRGSRMNAMISSSEYTGREGRITPANISNIYPQDSSDSSYPHLPDIRRSPLPTNEMRRYLRQAASRRH